MKLFRCTRCLYPSSKPEIWFSDDGLCSACIAFDKRKDIDWSKRQDEFLKLVNENRGKTHDVIVACSGGKDSTWQVVKCLELGLRPLAVTATTDHLSELGRKNLDNISNLCDHIEITPHKPTRKKIAKFALNEVGDISWCEHHLIWSVPAREAVARQIPIVLYGECPQNEYGAGPQGTDSFSRLSKAWVDEFGGLLGLRLSDVSEILDIDPKHLNVYRYPVNVEEVQAVFMGAYFDWDGYRNAEVARENGFTWFQGNVEGSLYGYENLDNLQTSLHDEMRWWKFGYGRICDIASSHIRRGRLTRERAAQLAWEREGISYPTYLGVPVVDILANIGMTYGDYLQVCERFVNKEVIAWASRRESYQCFYLTSTDASKEGSSTQAAA